MSSAPPRTARPRVVVTRRLPDEVEARMAELFDTRFNASDTPLGREGLAAAMADCDVLVPTVADALDAALIAAAPARLRLIASFGAGVDHIDLKAARARGILVTNTPGVLTDDTADMTIALIVSVVRRLAEGEKLIRSGGWSGWGPCVMLGHRLAGKTLGIIGMGRIGQAVARRARAFGLEVHYHNRERLPEVVEQETAATWRADLDEMLADVDIASIHCPHTPETHHLLGPERIALIGGQGYLINIARGEIVQEGALIDALERGGIAGAGLDVFEHEPAIDPRLLALQNVVLLPHMGSATVEARSATGAKVIANIRAWGDGHRPPDQVIEGWA